MPNKPISKAQELKTRQQEFLAAMSEADKRAAIRKGRRQTFRMLAVGALIMGGGIGFQFFYNGVLRAELPLGNKLQYLGSAVAFVGSLFVLGCLVPLVRPSLLVSEAATKQAVEARPDLKEEHRRSQARLGCLLIPALVIYAVLAIKLFY